MRRLAIALLLACVSIPAFAAPCAGFTDVDDGSAFCTSVTWIKNRGITLGCTTATLYCPNDYVTRLQMAAFLYRLGFQNAFLQGGNAFGAAATIGTTDNQPMEVHVNGSRVMRYAPNAISPNLIGGHPANSVTAGVRGATIAGGGVPLGDTDPDSTDEGPNRVADPYGTVGGGYANVAGKDSAFLTDAMFATVGGGRKNSASAQHTVVAGGYNNTAGESYSTVAGGSSNTTSGFASTVAGGDSNTASGHYSTVGGGDSNTASGPDSTVPGGRDNLAAGRGSFAAGFGAHANNLGCFVYSDGSSFNPTSCDSDHRIVMRGVGGFYFYTGGTSDATYTGAALPTGAGAWGVYSDRHGKELVQPVDVGAILDKLVAIPIATWQWRNEPGAVRHMGPMAQDFHHAFGLGHSDKQIVTVDADGVALAAIQGLNAKLEARIAEQAREIAELRRVVELLLARNRGEGTLAQTR